MPEQTVKDRALEILETVEENLRRASLPREAGQILDAMDLIAEGWD